MVGLAPTLSFKHISINNIFSCWDPSNYRFLDSKVDVILFLFLVSPPPQGLSIGSGSWVMGLFVRFGELTAQPFGVTSVLQEFNYDCSLFLLMP